MVPLGACLWIRVVSGTLPFQAREGSRGEEPVLMPCLPAPQQLTGFSRSHFPLGTWTLLSYQLSGSERSPDSTPCCGLRALALYRQACVRELGHGPKDFSNPDTDNAWLKL